jgi:hypothetical protein
MIVRLWDLIVHAWKLMGSLNPSFFICKMVSKSSFIYKVGSTQGTRKWLQLNVGEGSLHLGSQLVPFSPMKITRAGIPVSAAASSTSPLLHMWALPKLSSSLAGLGC